MKWDIEYIKEALRDLKRLDAYNRKLILKAIEKTAERPLPPPDGIGKPLGNLRFCLRTAKRRVRKRDFLPVFRDTPVNFRRTRLQIFAERSALLYDLRAEQNKALVPNIKRIDKLRVTRNIL